MSTDSSQLIPNAGKQLLITQDNITYARLPVKTHVVTAGDNILEICKKYAQPFIRPGDTLFISERVVAISQGRAYPISEIKPSWLANFLVRFVHKSPYGIGLGSPWTMELALREAGKARILFATFIAAITKPFGVKGIFYKVAGHNINAIDGPCSYTLPPYNGYAKLGPDRPNEVAQELKASLGIEVVIIDANDLGVAILGRSSSNLKEEWCKAMFKDNPLGQSTEQTPLCLVREAKGPV
jgi:F420-0:gamma-glutamyl ligase-like protein